MPRAGTNSSGRCRERPSKTVTIAPQAGTYTTAPEGSRLIGSGNGNGAACREQKDLSGDAGESEEVNVPPGESPNTYTFTRHAIRSNYMDKSIEAKKKVSILRLHFDEFDVFVYLSKASPKPLQINIVVCYK